MSRQGAIEAAIAAMEPEAARLAQEVGWKEAVEMSRAISAKRQADALAALAACAWVSDGEAGFIRTRES